MADNLESLDNTSLREKCIQYGLPNVPVTDSSRKVLIKRLRVSMGGGGGGVKATKPRDANPKKATTVNTTTAEKLTPRKAQSRRTIAEALLPKADVIKPHIEKTSYVQLPTVQKNQSNVSTQQEEVRPVKRASSLTPSEQLALSGVITTSYNYETAVLEDDDEEEDDEEEPYNLESPIESNANRPLPSYQTELGLAHPIGGFFKETKNDIYISNLADKNKRSSPSTSVPSYGIKSGTTLPSYGIKSGTTVPSYGIKSDSTIPSYGVTTGSTVPSYRATSGASYLGSDRSYTRNSFSPLSQPKIDINKPSLSRRYTEYTTVTDGGDNDEVEEVQTPYLSSFARSLERLKSGDATNLGAVRKPTSLYGQRQVYGYSGTAAVDDSISGALRQFVLALEHKYQLKRAFALFLVFVFAVFIYVFFIM